MTQKQKSRTTKSPLMKDWVFRLGFLLRPSYQSSVGSYCDFIHCMNLSHAIVLETSFEMNEKNDNLQMQK